MHAWSVCEPRERRPAAPRSGCGKLAHHKAVWRAEFRSGWVSVAPLGGRVSASSAKTTRAGIPVAHGPWSFRGTEFSRIVVGTLHLRGPLSTSTQQAPAASACAEALASPRVALSRGHRQSAPWRTRARVPSRAPTGESTAFGGNGPRMTDAALALGGAGVASRPLSACLGPGLWSGSREIPQDSGLVEASTPRWVPQTLTCARI